MKKTETILISAISDFVCDRNHVRNLFNEIYSSNYNLILFDFEDVEMISRSATDEFIIQMNYMNNKNIKIELLNMNHIVESLFSRLRDEKSVKRYTHTNRVEIKCAEDRAEYFLAL